MLGPKKLTQKRVAELVPVSPGHPSRWETADFGPPSDEVIERLAEVLEADAAELMEIAGREVSSDSFQRKVLGELAAIRSSLKRIEAALAATDKV